MAWFIKTETFRRPREEVEPHRLAHLVWVKELQRQGQAISSGYLVDAQGSPGGGGLLLLEATDHADALALVQQDPLVASGSVDWQLQGWIAAAGDLAAVP
jgi:uncharacterized protein YciI